MAIRLGNTVRGLSASAIVGAAVTLGAGTPALAQFQPPSQQNQNARPVAPKPPRPQKADTPPTLWMMALTTLILAGVAGAALIPSKRGHQD